MKRILPHAHVPASGFAACWLACLFFLAISLSSCKDDASSARLIGELPPIYPDYTGVTVPTTIAPLNFRVRGDYDRIDARIAGAEEGEIHLQDDRLIRIPPKEWKEMLVRNKQSHLEVTVSLKKDGEWVRYTPFRIFVSRKPIDYGIVYRKIAPGYEIYSKMGIYERRLSDYEERPLFENTRIPSGCVNCHAFCWNSPRRMSLHLRGEHGGTFLSIDGETSILDTSTGETISSCVYPYWHPEGRFIAYSVNQTQQVFRAARDQRVEVLDLASDIVVYDTKENVLTSCPQLKSSGAYETFPAFSPDGKWLYFCTAAPRHLPADYQDVRYDLCRIAFDPESGTFGTQVDTLVHASREGKSVSFPRPSPDGRFVMYTLSSFGNFSIWHRDADLWLLNLRANKTQRLDAVNSGDVESYHSWTRDGWWFVFSSRRENGLYTRPYIASIDTAGCATKPFPLPQEDPEQDELSLYSYNIPEFVSKPVDVEAADIAEKALSPERKKVAFRR